jgi:hypothetical protein
MIKTAWTIALLSTLLITATSVKAEEFVTGTENFYIAPSVFYYAGLRERTSKDNKGYLVYDLSLGYQVHPNVYLGLKYQSENEETKTSGYSSASLNNSSKSTRTSLGASLGYVTQTYHLMFTYYVDSKWRLNTTTSSGSNRYEYAGSGMQLDVGYKIPLWSFIFGPQLSYKMYTYGKLKTDGKEAETISPKLEDTGVEPSLVFFYFC